MLFATIILAVMLSAPKPPSEGDAIVAAAWERIKNRGDPATACVEAGETMAYRIRHPDEQTSRLFSTSGPDRRPDAPRLRRIAKGEGATLPFDIERLGLPSPSPACKARFWVNAPVRIDDYAYVHVGMTCSGLCGYGEILLLKRRGGAWRVSKQLMLWVS